MISSNGHRRQIYKVHSGQLSAWHSLYRSSNFCTWKMINNIIISIWPSHKNNYIRSKNFYFTGKNREELLPELSNILTHPPLVTQAYFCHIIPYTGDITRPLKNPPVSLPAAAGTI